MCSQVVATLGTYPYQVIRSLMQQRQQVGWYVSNKSVMYVYSGDLSIQLCSLRDVGNVARKAVDLLTYLLTHSLAYLLTYSRTYLLQVGYDRVALEGTAATAAKLWREEGVRGFYRGLGTSLIRSTPQASLTLLAYENLLRLFSTGQTLSVVAPA